MRDSGELRVKRAVGDARVCPSSGVCTDYSIELRSSSTRAALEMSTPAGLLGQVFLLCCFVESFVGGATALAFEKSENLGFVTAPPKISYPFRIEALCSLYSKYEVCHPVLTESSFSANFPTEFLRLTAKDITSITIYDSRRREINYLAGATSTVLLGPYGLIGFLATRNVGDIDFGFTYFDNGRKRTAYVRFKNNNSTTAFGEALQPLIKSLEGASKNN